MSRTGDSQVLLIVAANPETTGELRLDKEVREIEARLASAAQRDELIVRSRWAVRPSDFIDALNDFRPSLLHFIGHGETRSIILESHDDDAHEISTDALIKLLRTASELRCVVLNACFSEPHAIGVAQHLEAAIGMRGSIGDEAAAVFSAAFYRALASGRDLRNAFEQGIAAMVWEHTDDEEVPKLHTRPGVSAEDVYFTTTRGPAAPATEPRLTVVLDATLDELDPTKLGQILGELRKLSGDVRLEIGRRLPGSVRLEVHTTENGAARLAGLHQMGGLGALARIPVLGIDTISSRSPGQTDDDVQTGVGQDAGSGPEWREVEWPFLDQLASMGWKVVVGSVDHPSVTGRTSFREVLMREELRQALRRINTRDGDPWLDDARLSQAVSALERIGHQRLIEANQEATALLLGGVQVEGLAGWDGGRARTVHYVDWDRWRTTASSRSASSRSTARG